MSDTQKNETVATEQPPAAPVSAPGHGQEGRAEDRGREGGAEKVEYRAV